MGTWCSGHTCSACGTPWVQSPVCPRLAADYILDELARHAPHTIHIDRWEWHARDTYANVWAASAEAACNGSPAGPAKGQARKTCILCISFRPPAALREPDLQGRPLRKPCPVAQLDVDVGRIMSCPHRTLTPGCPSPVETAQATTVGISTWEVRCSLARWSPEAQHLKPSGGAPLVLRSEVWYMLHHEVRTELSTSFVSRMQF